MILHGSPNGKLEKRIVALVDVGIGPGALAAQFSSSPAPSPGAAPSGHGGSPSVKVLRGQSQMVHLRLNSSVQVFCLDVQCCPSL